MAEITAAQAATLGIKITQPASISMVEGTNGSMGIVVTVPASVTVSYQWQCYVEVTPPIWKDQPENQWISGTKTNVLKFTNLTIADCGTSKKFRCIVTAKVGTVVYTITSNIVTRTLSPKTVVKAPTITKNLTDATINAGQSHTFEFVATGSPAPTYQWQMSTNGGTAWTAVLNSAPYSGLGTSKLTINNATTAMSGYKYRCVAMNSGGNTWSAYVTLTVKAAATTTGSTSSTSTTSSTGSSNLTVVTGSQPVIASIHKQVRAVLGNGYDISGEFAKLGSEGRVLDLDKLNTNKLIRTSSGGATSQGTKVVEEGRKQYSKKVEEDLGISVSGNVFGVTFASDTKKHFDKTETSDESYKYVMINLLHSNEQYSIAAAPEQIRGALSSEFKNALETMTAENIIKSYGTHVLTGMVLGSSMRYYMSFKKSVNTLSQTKTFSTSNSIGYGSGGTDDKKGKDDNAKKTAENNTIKPSEKSFGEKVVEAVAAGISVQKIKEAYAALKSIQEVKPGSNAPTETAAKSKLDSAVKTLNSAGISIQLSSTYSTSESINSMEELESMRTECYLIGGKVTENYNILNDPSNTNCTTWLNSCNDRNNWAWVDFIKNSVIPIYEFVPDGHSKKQAIKTAYANYLASKGITTQLNPVTAEIVMDFETRRERNKTVFNTRGDWEMSLGSGSRADYSLKFELVNIDGGTAGVDVTLEVIEDSKDQSTIVVHELIPLKPLPSQGFDKFTIYPKIATKYDRIKSYKKGTNQTNDWFDLTAEARSYEYGYNASTGNGCLDLNYPLRIQVDGKGNDWDNVAVKGRFKVKVIGYKR